MDKLYTPDEILNSLLVKTITKNLFQDKETAILKRPASFVIHLKNEPEDRAFRIVILPPHGFTANQINETTPHPEVRTAKIEIKGGIKPKKSGFNLLKKVIKLQYYPTRNIFLPIDNLYPKINGPQYQEKIKSSKEKFFVVKENGLGFYHSLVNLSTEWLLLILEKELRVQKAPDLTSKISTLDKNQQRAVTTLYKKVLSYGDNIFEKESRLIKEICSMDVDKIMPSLIEMLNVLESGNHESCTVYALILKIGRDNNKVIRYLNDAAKDKAAPLYYLKELVGKLSKQ